MMLDPFSAIFAQASLHGLRLDNFFQLDSGVFKANWRRDPVVASGRSQNNEPADCSQFVESTDPFHALKDSLAVALRTLPAPAPVVDADLFGGLL